METKLRDIRRGSRVILYPWPEEGIDRIEVGVVRFISYFDREALVCIPSELRDPDDHDGLREVFFDPDLLIHLEILVGAGQPRFDTLAPPCGAGRHP